MQCLKSVCKIERVTKFNGSKIAIVLWDDFDKVDGQKWRLADMALWRAIDFYLLGSVFDI